MVLNSLSFCLSVKLLISPSYLNEIFTGYSNLCCRLFSFITLSMSCHSLLAWRVSIKRSDVILMGIPLCVICCFSFAAFNIHSLCLSLYTLSVFPVQRRYFRICWRAGLVVLNSLRFCLSVKLLVSACIWMRSLLGTVIWAVGYFLSSLWVCLAIPSWPEEFLLKDQLLFLLDSYCI